MKKQQEAASTSTQFSDAKAAQLLLNLPSPVLLIDEHGVICYANNQAEEFFSTSAKQLTGTLLSSLSIPPCPLTFLAEQVRRRMARVVEHDVRLSSPRQGCKLVSIEGAPIPDEKAAHVTMILIHERTNAHAIDHQFGLHDAARSVGAVAMMLAHEVKNPLSGIRGAAQLIARSVTDADRVFTRLICDETDRIVALIDRMEAFDDQQLTARAPVNIHSVLEHVRRLALAGFATGIRFIERYDPSLPPVYGNRDQLTQVFINLIKNATEAISGSGGEISLTTAFQQGASLTMRKHNIPQRRLPILVSIADNGPGVPEEIQNRLFEPFVTGKARGTGLGLALAARVVGDHGGMIACERVAERTIFKLALPMAEPGTDMTGEA